MTMEKNNVVILKNDLVILQGILKITRECLFPLYYYYNDETSDLYFGKYVKRLDDPGRIANALCFVDEKLTIIANIYENLNEKELETVCDDFHSINMRYICYLEQIWNYLSRRIDKEDFYHYLSKPLREEINLLIDKYHMVISENMKEFLGSLCK